MIQRLALEIAGRTMFSLEMGRRGPELRDQIMRYGQTLGRPHLLDFVVPIGLPTPRSGAGVVPARLDPADRPDHGRAADGQNHASRPRDLLDLLMAARDPESGQGFSPGHRHMILAGHETTAVALCWSVYLVAQVPEVQERIAQEAITAVSGSGAESPSAS